MSHFTPYDVTYTPEATGGGEGGVTVHGQLSGRSSANQHPDTAISVSNPTAIGLDAGSTTTRAALAELATRVATQQVKPVDLAVRNEASATAAGFADLPSGLAVALLHSDVRGVYATNGTATLTFETPLSLTDVLLANAYTDDLAAYTDDDFAVDAIVAYSEIGTPGWYPFTSAMATTMVLGDDPDALGLSKNSTVFDALAAVIGSGGGGSLDRGVTAKANAPTLVASHADLFAAELSTWPDLSVGGFFTRDGTTYMVAPGGNHGGAGDGVMVTEVVDGDPTVNPRGRVAISDAPAEATWVGVYAVYDTGSTLYGITHVEETHSDLAYWYIGLSKSTDDGETWTYVTDLLHPQAEAGTVAAADGFGPFVVHDGYVYLLATDTRTDGSGVSLTAARASLASFLAETPEFAKWTGTDWVVDGEPADISVAGWSMSDCAHLPDGGGFIGFFPGHNGDEFVGTYTLWSPDLVNWSTLPPHVVHLPNAVEESYRLYYSGDPEDPKLLRDGGMLFVVESDGGAVRWDTNRLVRYDLVRAPHVPVLGDLPWSGGDGGAHAVMDLLAKLSFTDTAATGSLVDVATFGTGVHDTLDASSDLDLDGGATVVPTTPPVLPFRGAAALAPSPPEDGWVLHGARVKGVLTSGGALTGNGNLAVSLGRGDGNPASGRAAVTGSGWTVSDADLAVRTTGNAGPVDALLVLDAPDENVIGVVLNTYIEDSGDTPPTVTVDSIEWLWKVPAEGSGGSSGVREFLTPQAVLVNETSLTNENLVMAPEGYTFAIIDSDTVADGLYEADGSDTLALVKEIGELGDMIFPDGVFDTFDDVVANTPRPRAIYYYAPHYIDTNWARIELDDDLWTTAGWDTGPLAAEFPGGGTYKLRDVVQAMGDAIAALTPPP